MTPPDTVAGHTAGIADVLDAAADLLTPEGAWTQGWSAKGARGGCTFALSPIAVCWCASGAIVKANGGADSVSDAANSFLRDLVQTNVPLFNDAPGRTQAEVIAKLREAANAARATSKEAQGNG